jgi:[ribosomal protein S18]-alanine N-acetyltransferase
LKPESALKIRPATAADIPAIAALESQADTAAHWSRQQYEEIFASSVPQRSVLVIEDATAIQGFLVATVVAGEWEIENVAVAVDARRRGLGSLLVGKLLDQARGENAHAVFLEVRESNTPASALYQKFGFAETGRRKDYYRNPREDAIVYRLSLR